MNFEDALFKFLVGGVGFLIGILFVLCFVYLPVALYNQAECLRAGYPAGKISIGLERYCTTLDGAVTVKVDKQ